MVGSQDLLVLVAIGLFLPGANWLPEPSRPEGQALGEFKKGISRGAPDVGAPDAKLEATLPLAEGGPREGG